MPEDAEVVEMGSVPGSFGLDLELDPVFADLEEPEGLGRWMRRWAVASGP